MGDRAVPKKTDKLATNQVLRKISNHFTKGNSGKSSGLFSSQADLRVQIFCRSTLQRLKETKFKVELAKLGFEDVLKQSRVRNGCHLVQSGSGL